MITPRQENQIRAAIQKQGLIERDFNLFTDGALLRISYSHLKANFYFVISERTKVPKVAFTSVTDAVVNIANIYLAFSIEHLPSLLSYPATSSLPTKQLVTNWNDALSHLNRWLIWIKKEYGPFETSKAIMTSTASLPNLTHLHPTIQQAASSLYANGYYRQALLDAFIAVDNAVRDKSQLAGSGTRLMETAFSPGNPVLKIGDSPDEQQGFMALFRGAMLAIRNPKAHSLNGTHDAQRALEWLSFASVLLRNLDEATLVQPSVAPPAS